MTLKKAPPGRSDVPRVSEQCYAKLFSRDLLRKRNFKAHAWLDHDGQVILDHREFEQYAPLFPEG